MVLKKEQYVEKLTKELEDAFNTCEQVIDSNLMKGPRTFQWHTLIPKSWDYSKQQALFNLIKEAYEAAGWKVKHDTGDQRDPYNVITIS